MKGTFQEMFKKFCLESTVLGLKYFYLYPDPISRCFWAVTMICIFLLALTLSWLLYNRFDEMPTRLTIENQYEPIDDLPYPSIAICSPNQITISSMKHFNKTLVDGNLTSSLETILPQLLGFYQPVIDFILEDLQQLQTLLDLNRYTVPEVMSSLPQTCDQFLKLCTFQGKSYPHCRGLFHPILTAHGLCCAFNNIYALKDKRRNERNPHHTSHLVRGASLMNDLTVVADYDPADALDGTIVDAGAIKVLFNDWSEFPADDMTNLVLTNAETFHILQATYTYCSEDVKQLPIWSRKCYLAGEHRLRFFIDYHNSDCDHLCFVRAVEEACHCLIFHVPYLRVERACNLTSMACIMSVKLHMNRWLQSEHCDCPRDCESRRYKVDMTAGNFNGLPYSLRSTYDGLTFNKSSSIMHFFFPNSVYVKQKQETVMSLISLASNLGGVFGLCLGCSAISVIEIIFYIYIAVKNYIKKRLRALRVKVMTDNF